MAVAQQRDVGMLRGELAALYPLAETTVQVAGREWTLTTVPGTDLLIDRVHTEKDLEAFPYGVVLWESAVGLAQWLAERAEALRGATVLELGAGVGLPGLVAAAVGAHVTQTDYQEKALAFAEVNALRNGIGCVRRRVGDFRAFPALGDFDVVLGSDILYERTLHDPLLELLPRLLCPRGVLCLSDPLRPQAFDFLDRMERGGWNIHMESRDVPTTDGFKEIALFLLRQSSR